MITAGEGDGMPGGKRYVHVSGGNGGFKSLRQTGYFVTVLGFLAGKDAMTEANCLARMSLPDLMRCRWSV